MAIKLEHLKRNRLRRKIAVSVNGEVDFIQVFNPTGEERIKLLTYFEESINTYDSENIESQGIEVFDTLYKMCTDIEFKDGDSIKDLLEMPSEEILLVHNEIQEIVQELMVEITIRRQTQLNSIHQALLSLEVKKKEEDINSLIKEKNLLDDEKVLDIIQELEKVKAENKK